ncbi:MAG TPA: TolC family protein [Thermoanaerobaculia bacterium]|nr:TolC family protein [Thermoanaerobaculia bacterium]
MIAFFALLAVAAVPALPAEPQIPPRPILTLDQALATAGSRQPQLQAAAAATLAAQARSGQALAALRPQVSGIGSYQRATANFVSRPGALPRQLGSGDGGESSESFGFYSFGLSASYLLYDFGQGRDRWRSAEASFASQRGSERATASQVRFAVRTAFFQARAARALVTVAEETLANQRKHLEQTKGFVDVGTQPPIALAQARTAVSNAQVQEINAVNAYDTAKAQLNQAMGIEQSTDYDVADETPPPVPAEDGSPDALLDEALRARPEIAALADQVRAEELVVRALRSSYWPSLGLATGVTDAGDRVLGGGLTWNVSAALQLSVPIYLGGSTGAQIAEGQANLSGARSQLAIERLQVRLEVEQARLAVLAAKSVLAASGDALENAQDQLHLAEGRYETGVGSIIELGDAQVTLTSAAQQQVQGEYGLAQARAQLVKALGRD